MKTFLPILFLTIFFQIFLIKPAGAQTINTQTGLQVSENCRQQNIPETECFMQDADVQFAGNVASRASALLNWVIEHHRWSEQDQVGNLSANWIFIRNIVYAILGLMVLAASFLLIITRGKSLTVRQFIPRFIFVALLVTLSFSLIQFLYQIGDTIQEFFLKKPGTAGFITDQDLLHFVFNYGESFGFRLADPKYDESVFTTLLLTKLTAISYYAMFIILVIRKIILWFFLIISPVFPLLLLFPLVRNSAKLWIGEFFRWLLYGVLFSMFLSGLVALWSATSNGKSGIPLGFVCNQPGSETPFTTSTALLLGGPCQQVSKTNSLNDSNTFIQYVVALLMLWAVIILPFILLKIFLDYFSAYSFTEANIVKYLAKSSSPLLNRYGLSKSPSPPPEPIPGGAGAGLARQLPSFEHSAVKEIEQRMAETAERQQKTAQISSEQIIQQANQAAQTQTEQLAQANMQTQNILQNQSASQTPLRVTVEESRTEPISSMYPKIAANFIANITTPVNVATEELKRVASEIINLTNLSIPKMADIARFEEATISSQAPAREEVNKLSEIISRIAGTSAIATPAEKERFISKKERLVAEAQKGNAAAFSVLSAAAPAAAQFPEANRVQQINLDDYEQVKKLWTENYRKLEPPLGSDGKPQTKKEWLKNEIKKIPEVIDLLLSGDPEKVKRGKEMVNKILPFLLLGGFSLAEIIAYLKAKLEAAKQVMDEVLQVEGDEESKVKVEIKTHEQPKQMSAEIPEPEDSAISPQSSDKY